MKKILKTFVLLLAVFLITNVFAGDKLMLVEFFTSSTCGPCASNNPILTAFMNSHDIERITAIGFHMNWPAPGNDPMYLYNTIDNEGRRGYYAINSIPQGRYDGLFTLSGYSTGVLQSYYDSRIDILSPVSIILTDSTFGDSVKVKAQVYCEQFMTVPNVNVYTAVVENHIHYSSPPGTNGETDFYQVMRKMLPNANGTQLTMLPGDTRILEYKYRKDPIWNPNEVYVMAWAQNPSTKEVYTAAKKTLNFTLLPNPGYKSVPQGQSSSATFKIKVPVVATGYNSPVTFTAAITPPTTGVTTSFPNGNVLSNFPDSISLQVNSTAAVPTGSYQIVVTGTNAASKYHKTVVNYLIGKNYVMIGTNRPNDAQFKVNGNTYTTSQLFEWNLGTTQTLQAISPVNSGDHQVVFQNWSNNGDTTQTITVNSITSTYLANYKIQFKLQTIAGPSGINPLVTISGGNTYYDSSAVASVSISPLSVPYNGTTYYFQRWMGGGIGAYNGTNPSFQVTMNNFLNQIAIYDTINTGIGKIGNEIPGKYELAQNYPNPFNPVTTIKFALPKAGDVKLKVYNVLGKEVDILQIGFLNAGYYQINFNAVSLSSGIYFYKLETDNFVDIKRMVLLK